MPRFVKAANAADCPAGQARVVEVEGQPIALYNVGGNFYATDNTCIHRGGPLGEGYLEGKEITCPWHAWRFDVTTGVSTLSPEAKVETFPVKVKAGEIYVGLP